MRTRINQPVSIASDTQQVRSSSDGRWVPAAALTPAEQHALRRSTALTTSRSRAAGQQARSPQPRSHAARRTNSHINVR